VCAGAARHNSNVGLGITDAIKFLLLEWAALNLRVAQFVQYPLFALSLLCSQVNIQGRQLMGKILG
jgi:hypothetical protein